jgi:hypothetical protein
VLVQRLTDEGQCGSEPEYAQSRHNPSTLGKSLLVSNLFSNKDP